MTPLQIIKADISMHGDRQNTLEKILYDRREMGMETIDILQSLKETKIVIKALQSLYFKVATLAI